MTEQLTLIPDEKQAPAYLELPLAELPTPDEMHDPPPAWAGSIAAVGMAMPILLRQRARDERGTGDYEICDGRRRLASCWALTEKLKPFEAAALGVNPVRCIVYPADYTHGEVLTLIANTARSESVWSEANAVEQLLEKGYSLDQVSKELLIPRSRLLKRMRLLALPQPLFEGLRDGKLKPGVAELVATLPAKLRQKCAERFEEQCRKLTGDDVRELRQVGVGLAVNAMPDALFQVPRLEDTAPASTPTTAGAGPVPSADAGALKQEALKHL